MMWAGWSGLTLTGAVLAGTAAPDPDGSDWHGLIGLN